jgi:hypothetical protein
MNVDNNDQGFDPCAVVWCGAVSNKNNKKLKEWAK